MTLEGGGGPVQSVNCCEAQKDANSCAGDRCSVFLKNEMTEI